MCNLVSCDHNSGGSGFDVVDAAKAVVLIAAFGGAIAVISVAPLLFFLLYLAVVTVALATWSKWVRQNVWKPLLRWLALEAYRTWSTRNQRPVPVAAPSTALAVPQPWHATLYGGPQELTSGTVYGTWTSVAACQAEVEEKARGEYLKRGQRPPAELRCVAMPLGGS